VIFHYLISGHGIQITLASIDIKVLIVAYIEPTLAIALIMNKYFH
jgi:hypothetical protein